MALSFLERCFSIPSNQKSNLSKFRSLISAIFFPATLNHKLSFFNLAPSQLGQCFNSINCSTHSRSASVIPVPVNQRLSMGTTPSNTPSYGLDIAVSSISNVDSEGPSGVPYNSKLMDCSDKLLMGLSRLILCFFASTSTCLNK